MQIIQHPYILAIIPFIAIIVAGYLLDVFPKQSIVTRLLNVLAEKDLKKLMLKAGLTKTSVTSYQILRIGSALAIALVLFVFGDHGLKEQVIICVIFAFGVYKLMYFYLVLLERNRIKKLNDDLPYCMKAVAYLCYLYPVNNAFEKAIDYVPDVFRYDLETLVKEIDKDPLSVKPYMNWVERYDNKLGMLKTYLMEFYRMSTSSSKEQEKLLANINSSISNEIRRVRLSKNNAINSAITWLGMIPVFLLGFMLMSLLVVIIDFI